MLPRERPRATRLVVDGLEPWRLEEGLEELKHGGRGRWRLGRWGRGADALADGFLGRVRATAKDIYP